MERPEVLKRKIKSSEQLQSVVKTMKALAAVNIRQYEKGLDSLKEYRQTVESGFKILIKQHPELIQKPNNKKNEKNTGIVVFGSEQGMAGPFNDQLARFMESTWENKSFSKEKLTSLCFGERILTHLEDRGINVYSVLEYPGSINEITLSVQNFFIILEDWRESKHIDQVFLYYNRITSGTSYKPNEEILIPFDPAWLHKMLAETWDGRSLPFYTLDTNRLFKGLIHQILFIKVYEAFVESLASENGSRLVSMQVAQKNIEDRLYELKQQYNRERQTSITAELLDIVAGFEALK